MQQDDNAAAEEECLTEIRFYVPTLGDTEEAMEPVVWVGGLYLLWFLFFQYFHIFLLNSTNFKLPFGLTAQNFNKEITRRAQISDGAADSLFRLKQLLFLIPRGRYDVDAHEHYLKLHGPSTSYNILYKNIQHFFLLQRPDSHLVFVVCFVKGFEAWAWFLSYVSWKGLRRGRGLPVVCFVKGFEAWAWFACRMFRERVWGVGRSEERRVGKECCW